ncbi:hypothetical protein EJB05_38046, partial [Eragrostis curvula]
MRVMHGWWRRGPAQRQRLGRGAATSGGGGACSGDAQMIHFGSGWFGRLQSPSPRHTGHVAPKPPNLCPTQQNRESKIAQSEKSMLNYQTDKTKSHLIYTTFRTVIYDVFFGGIETSASTLDFTIAELMRRLDLMSKLQADVRSKVPEGQEFVSEANLADMNYLRAVIKETLRLHPVTPVLAHFSMSSGTIDGFEVPARVRILINAWAIGRDERFWEDAEEFVPERFLDSGSAADVEFKGNDFRFFPFGVGRRMCPGINFGMVAMELMLANLVHHFDWELPPGQDRLIDMSEVFGIVVHRKEKLLLVPKLLA